MPPKRRFSERLQSRGSERPETHSNEQSTSADNSKRRRTEPEDETSAALSTQTSPNGDAPSSTSGIELEDEVLIQIGALTIRVHRERLRETFGFFAKFSTEDFPKKFSLSCRGDPDIWSSWRLIPNDEANTDNDQEQDVDTESAEAHQSLLELVSLDLKTLRISLKKRELDVWPGIACLLARYEATESIKLDFGGHLLDVVVEKDLLRDDPCAMLEIGYFLKREEYFRTAMTAVVRQYHTTKSDVRHLCDDLRNSVADNVRKLEIRVQQLRMNILWKLSLASDCSSMLAYGNILQRLMRDHEAAIFIKEPTNPKVYYALRALRDWRWNMFEDRMVPEIYRQLFEHDRMISSAERAVAVASWKESSEGEADALGKKLHEVNYFSLQLVRDAGQRVLREISEQVDACLDNDHSYFRVDPPTTYPWK